MQKKTFAYKIEQIDCEKIGSIVEVGFGKKKLIGIILSITKQNIENGKINLQNDKFLEIAKVKNIDKFIYLNLLSETFIEFLKQMAWYNIIEIERLLEIVVPTIWLNKKRVLKELASITKKKKNINDFKIVQLSEEQNKIANEILLNGFNVNLIRGSMGSGKTYIFLEVVRKKLFENQNNQILIMVPEISLTNTLIDIIKTFTGVEPIIWHSSVSSAKKKIYYENIVNGKIKIVVSTRSGLLLPYKNLSLIVIDEEHDISYKQDEIPCYNARDMAILRAKYENIPVILSSATPSIETIFNVMQKKYVLHTINHKFFNSELPKIILINTNIFHNKSKNIEDNNNKMYSKYIAEEAFNSIIKTFNKKEQTMIFINRRGYSRTLKCDNCGYEAKCENCDNLLSYHKTKQVLKCHYCGYKIDNITKCQKCGGTTLSPNKGVGVEQIKQEVLDFAKKTNITLNTILFSSDEISKEEDIDALTSEIKNGNVDVIIGTQIMTKGHHFPRLTNIIVLDIDGMSLDGDFRAYERMFQMLFQLSGRAGREKNNSNIYIQTSNPENIVLQSIKNYDVKGFYTNELNKRKQYNLPPYSRFIAIIISSEIKELAYDTAKYVYQQLVKCLPKKVEILGPTESNLHFLKKQYRYRLLLKSSKTKNLQQTLNEFKKNLKLNRKVMMKIDVDCYNFL